jgi:hypothetical protein
MEIGHLPYLHKIGRDIAAHDLTRTKMLRLMQVGEVV